MREGILDFQHETVLLEETVESTLPRPGGRYIDATLGGGGHTALLLSKSGPDGTVLAFDQDATAIEHAEQRFTEARSRLSLAHANFGDMEAVVQKLAYGPVDGILFDLGVSSPQFDMPIRGFSYSHEGPLDMRMDLRRTQTAETLVNERSEEDLALMFFRYGEEKFSRAIARRIVQARCTGRIVSTTALADIVKAAIPAAARRTGPHPARRVFQALRIAVNDELGALEMGITSAFRLLRPGGRLAVISFHSLEDRIVKQMFREFATGCICPPEFPICVCGREPQAEVVTRKPIEPSDQEQSHNPRARSAKLRVLEKRDTR